VPGFGVGAPQPSPADVSNARKFFIPNRFEYYVVSPNAIYQVGSVGKPACYPRWVGGGGC
jgi:hypothetical protein